MGFYASEEPASELFGVKRCGVAIELGVGLIVWSEEKSGSIAGEDQLIEGGELSRLMMISWHSILFEIYQWGLLGQRGWGSEGWEVALGRTSYRREIILNVR